MKKELLLVMLLLSLTTPYAIAAEVDKCAACKLVTSAEMKAVMGEPKGEAKCDTGLRPEEVTCNYDNMAGSRVKIRLYKQSSGEWSIAKSALPHKTPLTGLGDEAFWTKEGTDVEVFVRKGEKTLEVDSSGGLPFAKPVAEKAFVRLK